MGLPPRITWDQRVARQRAELPAVQSHVRTHSVEEPDPDCRYCAIRAARIRSLHQDESGAA